MQKSICASEDALLRLSDVLRLIPVSRSTLYQWVKDGVFPKPIKLGSRVSAWRCGDVTDFSRQRNANQELN